MINFRYHVVSIVAVFLALALGMVMGTTVLRGGLFTQLQKDARDFRARNAEYRRQIDTLDSDIVYWEKFGAAIVPPLIKGKLTGKVVTLLIEDGASAETVDHVLNALRLARAGNPSRIRLTAAWNLTSATDRARLADAAESQATDDGTLLQDAANALGARLLSPSDPRKPEDVLVRWRDAGFLRFEDLPAAGAPFPAASSAIIVIPSGLKDAAPSQDQFFVTLMRSLARKRVVAVAEAMRSEDSLTQRVRDDAEIRDRVATIDHADKSPGDLSLVWVLRTLSAGGKAPHYGFQPGTDAVVPSVLQ